MSVSFTAQKSFSVGGKNFALQDSITADMGIPIEMNIAAAKVGTLTTRTDDNTGELTMAASHGITTGARLDLYWDGGSRRGMTVGTVSVNAVPIDGGAGDVLPADETAITAMVPTTVDIAFAGNDVAGVAMAGDAKSMVVFATSGDAEIAAFVTYYAAHCDGWYNKMATANPLTGGSIAKIFLSHGDSTGSKKVRVGVALAA